jgi:type 1 fimbria pilin
MVAPRFWWWAVCMVAGLVGTPAAHAASVRISFSGAVVESTCGTNQSELQQISAGSVTHATCGTAQAASTPRAYRLSVAQLHPGSSDRLLNYFVGYLQNAGQTDVRLATQIYD